MRNNIVLLFKPHLHREITRGIFLWSVQNGGILSGRCFEALFCYFKMLSMFKSIPTHMVSLPVMVSMRVFILWVQWCF